MPYTISLYLNDGDCSILKVGDKFEVVRVVENVFDPDQEICTYIELKQIVENCEVGYHDVEEFYEGA